MDSLATRPMEAVVSGWLGSLLPDEFWFQKRDVKFRRTVPTGEHSISINVTTAGRGAYALAFYLRVRCSALQELLAEIGGGPEPGSEDPSIWCYTANFGAGSGKWDIPLRGWWSVRSPQELEAIEFEVAEFISEIALPYLEQNSTHQGIRDTLLRHPGRAQLSRPFEAILGADVLDGDDAHLAADIEALSTRYSGPLREEFALFAERVRTFVEQRRKAELELAPAAPLRR